MIRINDKKGDESKKINDENFEWNDEFGDEFKKFHKEAVKLLEELFKNENWSLEKKFCEIYSLADYWVKNEKLLKNKYWNDYIISLNH
uniref:Uncharacterized protein n=1 Tax=Meloidogyne javanica TaxID=6303 RepID=A0A915M693_MELJA